MSKEKEPFALLMNDIHVSSDTIQEFKKNWNEALGICHKKGIHRLIIGGDLWQSRASQTLDVIMAVCEMIQCATDECYWSGGGDFEIVIAEGNHCKVDQEAYAGYSHIFRGYPRVSVVDNYMCFDVSKSTRLFVMSYFPENTSFKTELNDMIDEYLDEDMQNILYCHEGINGALATPADKELSPKVFGDYFDKILVGHYHNRTKIKGTNIEYIGASRQHNFGEDEEKGYTILYDDGSTEFVKNKANIRFMTIDINYRIIQNVKTYADLIDNIHETSEEGRYKQRIRISCKPSEADKINRRAIIEAGANKVEICTLETMAKIMESKSFEHKFDKQGIKDEYTSFCEGKGILDVETGLYYLEKL